MVSILLFLIQIAWVLLNLDFFLPSSVCTIDLAYQVLLFFFLLVKLFIGTARCCECCLFYTLILFKYSVIYFLVSFCLLVFPNFVVKYENKIWNTFYQKNLLIQMYTRFYLQKMLADVVYSSRQEWGKNNLERVYDGIRKYTRSWENRHAFCVCYPLTLSKLFEKI